MTTIKRTEEEDEDEKMKSYINQNTLPLYYSKLAIDVHYSLEIYSYFKGCGLAETE